MTIPIPPYHLASPATRHLRAIIAVLPRQFAHPFLWGRLYAAARSTGLACALGLALGFSLVFSLGAPNGGVAWGLLGSVLVGAGLACPESARTARPALRSYSAGILACPPHKGQHFFLRSAPSPLFRCDSSVAVLLLDARVSILHHGPKGFCRRVTPIPIIQLALAFCYSIVTRTPSKSPSPNPFIFSTSKTDTKQTTSSPCKIYHFQKTGGGGEGGGSNTSINILVPAQSTIQNVTNGPVTPVLRYS